MNHLLRHPIACTFAAAGVVLASLALTGCTDTQDKDAATGHAAPSTQPSRPSSRPTLPGYDLARPKISFALPPELTEISGLTDIDDHTVACVQDEVGTIFFVDLRNGAVTRRLHFAGKGDYEGLTRVGKTLWALRSDGRLIEVVPRDDAVGIGRRVKLDIGHADIEGLAYDPFRKVLLVAPKDSQPGGKRSRDSRHVFAVDPVSGKLLAVPALRTSRQLIIQQAAAAGIGLPGKTTKKGRERPDLKVRFSSVAVHPLTRQIYVLSAADRAVLAFDGDGRLCAAHFFEGRAMPKLEAMTFLDNGDLVMASEGVGTPPRIVVFGHSRQAPEQSK